LNIRLLNKFKNNKCTPEELDEVIQWLVKSPERDEDNPLLKSFLDDLILDGKKIMPDEDRILDRIHHTINLKHSGEFFAINDKGLKKKKPMQLLGQYFSRIAAVLFLPLFLYSLYTILTHYKSLNDAQTRGKQVYNEIKAPMGSIVNMELPDGTKVWLNNGSKLRFPRIFTGPFRRVHLEGEGYFEVSHIPKKTFVVSTRKLNVVAVGTRFNVMAYDNDPNIETSLMEGKVLIQPVDEGNISRPLVSLKPNEHFSYNIGNKEYTIQEKNTDEFRSWIDGKLIFRNVPIDQVLKKLSRWYNVEFNIRDGNSIQYSYTATFTDETLPQVLDLLKIATPLDYSITSRKKQPDGSFTKTKVILWTKNSN